MIFTTDRFLKVAIESLPEWNLNPGPMNLVQTVLPTELSDHVFNSHLEPILYNYSKLIFRSVFTIPFGHSLAGCHIWFNRNLAQVITVVVEWIDTYGIYHWRIFKSSCRKFAWVGFEATTTEFGSDALTNVLPGHEFNAHKEPALYN